VYLGSWVTRDFWGTQDGRLGTYHDTFPTYTYTYTDTYTYTAAYPERIQSLP
jgi:hypothetical protein